MERFVFISAIVIASIFAVGALLGSPLKGDWGLRFSSEGDIGGISQLVEPAAARLPAQAYEARTIRLRHVAARVVVTSEDRTDISIEIENPGATPTPEISLEGGRLTVDGLLSGRVGSCSESGVDLRGYGFVTIEEMPLITIRAPRNVDLSFTGAGRAEIGDTEVLDLGVNGCARAAAGQVAGAADLNLNGSGRIAVAGAESADINLNGSGQVRVEAVRAGAEAEINGSGEISIASLVGAATLQNRGSGSVEVLGGAVTEADIEVFGSGRVRMAAPAQRLQVQIFGSGDVDAPVSVGELEAEIFGSGDVRVREVRGQVRQQARGSGSVRVGE